MLLLHVPLQVYYYHRFLQMHGVAEGQFFHISLTLAEENIHA